MAITINGTGSITGLTAGGLPDGSVVAGDIANNAVTAGKLATTLDLTGKTVTLPSGTGGKILQVVQVVEQGVITFGTSLGDAMSGSITPSSTSSKVLVQWSLYFGRGADDYGIIQLYRGSSAISGATGTGNTGSSPNATGAITNRGAGQDYHVMQCLSGSYVDSPGVNTSTTYHMKVRCPYGANVYLNRPEVYNNNQGYAICAISTFTLFEVA
jgi:hypothetical protein